MHQYKEDKDSPLYVIVGGILSQYVVLQPCLDNHLIHWVNLVNSFDAVAQQHVQHWTLVRKRKWV